MTNLNKLILAASAAVGFAFASAAMADGYYVGGSIGYSITPKFGGTVSATTTTTADMSARHKGGYVVNLEGGMKDGQVRYGLEYSYNNSTIKDYNQGGTGYNVSAGRTIAQAFMGNVYYDFDQLAPFTPYVGLGLGYINVMRNAYVGGYQGYANRFGAFGYQGIVGAAYNLGNNMALTLDYRYLASMKRNMNVYSVTNSSVMTSISKRYQNHQFNLGLVYKFC